MYFNVGMDTKYPKPKEGSGVLANKSHDELKKLRDELRQLGLAEKEQKEREDREKKEALAKKYGEI